MVRGKFGEKTIKALIINPGAVETSGVQLVDVASQGIAASSNLSGALLTQRSTDCSLGLLDSQGLPEPLPPVARDLARVSSAPERGGFGRVLDFGRQTLGSRPAKLLLTAGAALVGFGLLWHTETQAASAPVLMSAATLALRRPRVSVDLSIPVSIRPSEDERRILTELSRAIVELTRFDVPWSLIIRDAVMFFDYLTNHGKTSELTLQEFLTEAIPGSLGNIPQVRADIFESNSTTTSVGQWQPKKCPAYLATRLQVKRDRGRYGQRTVEDTFKDLVQRTWPAYGGKPSSIIRAAVRVFWAFLCLANETPDFNISQFWEIVFCGRVLEGDQAK